MNEVGRATYDGDGSLTVTLWIGYHGKLHKENFSGTYSLGSNCTGSALIKSAGGAEIIAMKIVAVKGEASLKTLARYSVNTGAAYTVAFTQVAE